MQFDDAGGELAVFGGRGRFLLPPAAAGQRIVEGPMFNISLATLHHRAPDSGAPRGAIGGRIGLGEMQVGVGRTQLGVNPVEAEFPVGPFK